MIRRDWMRPGTKLRVNAVESTQYGRASARYTERGIEVVQSIPVRSRVPDVVTRQRCRTIPVHEPGEPIHSCAHAPPRGKLPLSLIRFPTDPRVPENMCRRHLVR